MHKQVLTLSALLAMVSPLCAHAEISATEAVSSNAIVAATDTKAKQHMSMQNTNQITPSAEPVVTSGATPFVTADFLWWKAQEDGLDYAFSGTTYADIIPLQTLHQASKGTVKSPHFSYKPGFKVGAGLKLNHDGWDLFAQYTWWRNNGKRSSTSLTQSTDETSFVILANPLHSAALADGVLGVGAEGSGLATPAVIRASANWFLHFNTLDLDMGRNFWVSKHLTLRPFIGGKFSWMSQQFKLHYFDLFEGDDTVFIRMKLKQWSAGIRAGLNTNWYMSKRWAFFGNLAIDSLWNHYHTSRKQHLTSPPTAVTNQLIENNSRNSNASTITIESALGLHFEAPFKDDRYMFLLDLSWEQQIWFDQNRFILPPATAANLTLSGATVKAGLYF